MRRHRDNIFNRVMNGYMRRAAERALRCDLAFNAADTAVLLVACQNDLFTPDGRGNDLTAGPEAGLRRLDSCETPRYGPRTRVGRGLRTPGWVG